MDGFKPIIDVYGHSERDVALMLFALQMLKSFRDSDIIGRVGGDEFVTLIIDSDIQISKTAVSRLQTEIDQC